MEATEIRKSPRTIRALALSIAALLTLVNARAQSLSSVNQEKTPSKITKNSKKSFDQLIQLLLQRGNDSRIGANLAPIIGLEKPTDAKQQDSFIKRDSKEADFRSCYVVFADAEKKQPMCLFMKRAKQTLTSTDSKYYRVSLTGQLERAVQLVGKRTTEQAIKGSGVTTVQDIESSEVRKNFDAEMAFWLKDWLKKESKKVPAKSASAVPAGKTAAAAL